MKMNLAQRTHWINGPWQGRLVIVPRPRGGDWLEDEVASWLEAGIHEVVSFLTPEEVTTLDLEAEKRLCEVHGIHFVSFPIPDRGVPSSVSASKSLLSDLEQSLSQGKNIALHCRQSVGRSALIGAGLLVCSGDDPRSAFERITLSRGSKVPDTAEQEQWVLALDSEDAHTRGERLFERYLWLQGIDDYQFELDDPSKQARPDYIVNIEGRKYIFEVKDFSPKDLLDGHAYDPYIRIRKKIDLARKKFREYKDYPCCLVLYNESASLVHLDEPHVVLGSMYGNYGKYEFNPAIGGYDQDSQRFTFLDGGKMLRPKTSQPQNTTISALITLQYAEVGQNKLKHFADEFLNERQGITSANLLREARSVKVEFDKYERHLGVTVWENRFARIPFPRHLFSGWYDVRWGQESSDSHVVERIWPLANTLQS